LAQLWQAPHEAVVQHVPLTQSPLRHWPPRVQLPPAGKRPMHMPPVQSSPLAHCELAVQLVGQPAVAPTQTYGAQEGVPGPLMSWQVPLGSAQLWHWPHDAEAQHVPFTQLPPSHWLGSVQVPPFAWVGTQLPEKQ
jgi:hypothetical protein